MIQASILPKCIGKPIKKGDFYYCGDDRISLGYNWTNITASFDDIFELLTVDGYAIAPALKSDNRRDINFQSAQLVLIDIDSGMNISELNENEFYQKYACGFYTTPSHTNENPRFRILHKLETPITDSQSMKYLYKALMSVYGDADPSCKDSTRLFYGSPNCKLKQKKEGVIDFELMLDLIQYIKDQDQEQIAYERVFEEISDSNKNAIVRILRNTYIGEYCKWRDIGWGMKTAGFTLNDFKEVTTGMMSKKTPKDAEKIWNAAKHNSISMGTILYYLRQYYGQDFKVPETNKDLVKFLQKKS